jgi:tetratricopeptide (TPR) repeat protein
MAVIIVVAMTAKLTAALRESPATVPSLAALALFVVWATDQAGYPLTHWAPGAILLLALLALTVGIVGLRLREVPRAVQVALACLGAYAVLSYLSILWAVDRGAAWEGADRTLLYLIVFALFACWQQRGATAVLLLGGWAVAMTALAGFVALHVDAAGAGRLQSLLPGGRLLYPSGYPNANAAQWLMACWPALLLARSSTLPWAVRGVLAGGAVLLADVALLSQSRGSFYATAVMLVLVFALLPGRLRTFALLVPVCAGVAASAPAVLAVGDHLRAGAVVADRVHTAVAATFAASVAVGAIAAAGAALDGGDRLGSETRARVRAAVGVAAAVALVAVLAAALAAAGNPVHRAESAWHSFKGGYGSTTPGGSRLVSGLGSNRYDFYRVALDEFVAHPLAGIGADNYQQQYLQHGRSSETPRYPHSVELRTLTETGVFGALLAVVGLAAALLAGNRALRGREPLAAAVAAAALGGFAYWLVHGSVDWFFEFAGLGAPAFAMLGLACALAPAERPSAAAAAKDRSAEGSRGRAARIRASAAGALVVLVLALALAAPWLGRLQVESAARIWARAPRLAYARLADAAAWNPLSDEAYLVAGSIALRYGQLERGDREFARALQRNPDDAYATLERGAIASARGERARALALLRRAVALSPRDRLARRALALTARGEAVDIDELNRLILLKARQLA